MTGINAYDGKDGWKIEPWQGKRDPEALGEEEMHGILDEADFDGPLVNYQAKGNKVEYQASSRSKAVTPTNSRSRGRTATSASTISIPSTTSHPHRYAAHDSRRAAGVRDLPRRLQAGQRRVSAVLVRVGVEGSSSSDRSKITYHKIEANVPLDDARFKRPGARP